MASNPTTPTEPIGIHHNRLRHEVLRFGVQTADNVQRFQGTEVAHVQKKDSCEQADPVDRQRIDAGREALAKADEPPERTDLRAEAADFEFIAGSLNEPFSFILNPLSREFGALPALVVGSYSSSADRGIGL